MRINEEKMKDLVLDQRMGKFITDDDFDALVFDRHDAIVELAARDAKIDELQRDIAALTAVIEQHQKAAAWCEKHRPQGGSRSACLVCALQRHALSFSKIDYLCGQPNTMEASGYDVHCDEGLVVEAVRRKIAAVTAEVERLKKSRDDRDVEIFHLLKYAPNNYEPVNYCDRTDSPPHPTAAELAAAIEKIETAYCVFLAQHAEDDRFPSDIVRPITAAIYEADELARRVKPEDALRRAGGGE